MFHERCSLSVCPPSANLEACSAFHLRACTNTPITMDAKIESAPSAAERVAEHRTHQNISQVHSLSVEKSVVPFPSSGGTPPRLILHPSSEHGQTTPSFCLKYRSDIARCSTPWHERLAFLVHHCLVKWFDRVVREKAMIRTDISCTIV